MRCDNVVWATVQLLKAERHLESWEWKGAACYWHAVSPGRREGEAVERKPSWDHGRDSERPPNPAQQQPQVNRMCPSDKSREDRRDKTVRTNMCFMQANPNVNHTQWKNGQLVPSRQQAGETGRGFVSSNGRDGVSDREQYYEKDHSINSRCICAWKWIHSTWNKMVRTERTFRDGNH